MGKRRRRTSVQKLSFAANIHWKLFRFVNSAEDITTDIRSIKLTVPSSDRTIASGLIGRSYEELELNIFERLAEISHTIIDVGAGIGLYSCAAAKKTSISSKIIAFEPLAKNLKYLRQNLEQNRGASRVIVEEEALSESTGMIDIHLVEGQIGNHSRATKSSPESRDVVAVRAVTLDEYVSENLQSPVDILRVDAGGHEGSALRGAKDILRNYSPTLLTQFAPNQLVNCGFSPAEFLQIIFDTYDHIFLVDQRGALKRFARRDLLRDDGSYVGFNLIAVNDARQDHLAVVEAVGSRITRWKPSRLLVVRKKG